MAKTSRKIQVVACLLGSVLAGSPQLLQAEPTLPAGLSSEEPSLPQGINSNEPALPAGMGSGEPDLPAGMDSSEPALPDFGADNSGAGSDDGWSDWGDSPEEDGGSWFHYTGFIEGRAGTRLRDPVEQRHTSLAETRASISVDSDWQGWHGRLTADLLYDDVADSQQLELEDGKGWLDLREAWASRRLGDSADLKAGRQILTWGVGDLVFINDLFPKDWQSFLAGRDEQYLKAPSDALRVGFYNAIANVNLIWSPRFDSDRYIGGERLSYYSSGMGEVVGRNAVVSVDKPDDSGDDELALRLYRQVSSFEVAAYAYDGYWKSPAGFDPATGLATFPSLRVYGASARGPVGAGIFSAEVGYYDSRDDSDGRDPWVNNSEWRWLLGYEWELVKNTTVGVQYYVEQLQDYSNYRDSLFPGQPAREENREVMTLRLTHLAMNQNLTLSLFAFYSPSDHDSYLRPSVSYKLTDNWLLAGGVNLFEGDKPYTFFGQFESNSNAWLALRYSFD
ncbi:hypothetical protein [Pseudomaricurvus sp. HS19]|uniref:hypothetical protein n=1 Tax=Pseudomaricurvus sp. HS19 TaxID=2692626 RepID=UPI001367CB15|nr:hypothetical protein [Pseudomaricurvus sp. HS19]MYM64107.1 hypothetical protein [Pseudomaricurvus sp. HS19]